MGLGMDFRTDLLVKMKTLSIILSSHNPSCYPSMTRAPKGLREAEQVSGYPPPRPPSCSHEVNKQVNISNTLRQCSNA